MMPKSQTDEQYPLLMFLVPDAKTSRNNKRHTSQEKGRFDGISSGAAQVLTEWPNNISSSWVTAFISLVVLFAMSLMLISLMNFQFNRHNFPRCVKNPPNNKTIHLVYNSRRWTRKQIEIIGNISEHFPDYKLHLLLIDKDFRMETDEDPPQHRRIIYSAATPSLNSRRWRRKRSCKRNKLTTNYLKSLFKNLEISIHHYSRYFAHTPMYQNWHLLDSKVRIFAVRVVRLWRFGGISFDISGSQTDYFYKREGNDTGGVILEKNHGLDELLRNGPEQYAQLDPEVVSIDNQGLHMATKTPCHAFFGYVLMKLAKTGRGFTPQSILEEPLYTYCQHQAIEDKFCVYSLAD